MYYMDILNKHEEDSLKDDIKFNNLLDYKTAVRRQLYLGDIEEGTGEAIELLIHFYNIEDEENNIPVEERIPIKLYINSCGGLISETFIMIDAIKMSKTPVWTICTGTAYSGGFFTFIAGHRRIAYEHSSFLYHEGSTQVGGTANQFANYAAFYKKELGKLKSLVLEKTNIDEEKYTEIQKDDFWMDATEAINFGVADEIAEAFV